MGSRTAWRYKDLLKQLVQRDIKLKYRRSFLGYLWSVMNPLFLMLIMTVVFSNIFKRDIENFPVYLFTGQVMFNFMNQSTHQAIGAITSNAALLKKSYVPRYIFPLSKITSGLVDFFFSLGALVIVMLITGSKFSWYNLLFIIPSIQLYIFCIGLGLFLAQANVFFRDIQYIYNAITTAWIYLTPIFYPIDALSEGLAKAILKYNPMYFYIAQFRDIIYANTMFHAEHVIKGCIVSVCMLLIGALLFKKNQDKFILYI